MEAAAAEQQQQLRSEQCLDGCAGKLIRANHRLMGAYVALMPSIVQRRSARLEDSAEHTAPGGPEAAPDSSPAGLSGAGT
uniref:Mitochondrial import inner membrane translocase subunit Tim10 B n=1 Tax=Pavo cristatus TaxID=9049 RepID=A0A8C9G1R4_PAVCR